MENVNDNILEKEEEKLIIKRDLFNSEENNQNKSRYYNKLFDKNNLKDVFLKIFYLSLIFICLIISYKIYKENYYSPKNQNLINNNNSTKEEFKNITKDDLKSITKDELKNTTKEYLKNITKNDLKNITKEELKNKNKEDEKTIENSKNKEDLAIKKKEVSKNSTDINKNDSKNKTELKKTKKKVKKDEDTHQNQNIKPRPKRVGIVGVENTQNPGNNLVKYAMSTKLREYGFDPIIISRLKNNNNKFDFLLRTVKLKIIKNSFSELKKEDYDILMVNSDLTWTFSDKRYFYDTAFLKFAQNWGTPKFIYGASMGTMRWFYSKRDDQEAKKLLKNFKGISLREIGTARMAEEHLGIKPTFVLDPTFLLEKEYYLDIIKNYKKDFDFNKNYLMVYQLDKNEKVKKFINDTIEKLNFTVYEVHEKEDNYVENFIFAMNISKAVITDSYHGSIFSIMFNKSFISYINFGRGGQRFASIKETFNLNNRIIDSRNSTADYRLLLEPLTINLTRLNELKNISISFLKYNLGI